MTNPLETAFRLQAEGRLDEAEALCRSVLKTAPKAAPAHYILGVIQHRRGSVSDAVKSFAKAAKLNPKDPGAQSGLAMVARDRGRFGEAETRARRALSLAPNDPNLMNGHAIALRDLHRLGDAIALWRKALSQAPQHLEVMLNLGVALDVLGDVQEAGRLLSQVHRAAAAVPEVAIAYCNHLQREGALEEARQALSAALAAAPSHGGLLELAAAVASALGKRDEADRFGWQAISGDPTRFAALNQILEGADDRKAVLARKEAQASVQAASALATEKGSAVGPASLIEAGRLLDVANMPDEAVVCLRRANDSVKAELIARRVNYDPGRMDRYVSTLCDAVRDHRIPQRPCGLGPTPIFVVGMPRSATSLVERIIGAHSACFALGELNGLQEIAQRLGSPHFAAPDAAWIDALAESDVAELGSLFADSAEKNGYPERMGVGADGPIPVDKNPLNLPYIPLALALWPEARVVWCRRSPAEIAFSIYARQFVRPLRFDCDIADIAHYGAAFDRLGAAMMAAYPDRMTALAHEDLVADSERTVRALLQALDLPFEEACLAPHELDHGTATASKAQVRQPINARGIGRAAKYDGLLALPKSDWTL